MASDMTHIYVDKNKVVRCNLIENYYILHKYKLLYIYTLLNY